MTRFADRLEEATYRGDEGVSIGVAQVGEQPEWMVNVSLRLFSRLQLIARAYELHILPGIEPYDGTRLNLQQVQSLEEELEFVATLSTDKLVQRSVAAIASAASRVSRSALRLELVVEGP